MNGWTVEIFAAGIALQIMATYDNINDGLERRVADAHGLYRRILSELVRLEFQASVPTDETQNGAE